MEKRRFTTAKSDTALLDCKNGEGNQLISKDGDEKDGYDEKDSNSSRRYSIDEYGEFQKQIIKELRKEVMDEVEAIRTSINQQNTVIAENHNQVEARFIEQNNTINKNHNQVEAKFTDVQKTIANKVDAKFTDVQTITSKVEAKLNQQSTIITNNHNQVQSTIQTNQNETKQQLAHLQAQFEAFKTGIYLTVLSHISHLKNTKTLFMSCVNILIFYRCVDMCLRNTFFEFCRV